MDPIATRRRPSKPRSAPKRKRSSAATKRTTPKVPTPGPGERLYVLEVPYEHRAVATTLGARWTPGTGWIYCGAVLPAALHPYLPRPYSWQAWRTDDLSGSPRGNATPDHSTGRKTLRPDQEDDVAALVTAHTRGLPEFLIASKVGTGKTLVTISAVKRMQGVRNVLVICPLSVVPNWRTHLEEMGDGGKRWCIVNYESTKNLLEAPASADQAKRTRTKNQRTAKHGVSRVAWDVIITDESHYLNNPESQRTMACERLILGRAADPAFVIRLSATAGSNPAQMSYLHRGLFSSTGGNVRKQITAEQYQQWCGERGIEITTGAFGSLTWSKDPADLKRMHALVFRGSPTWAIRREPDWPDQQRVPVPLDLDSAETAAYNAEWENFQSVMRTVDKVRRAGGSSTARNRAAAAARAKGLAAQTRYRQKAGQIRAAHTARFVAELVAKGHQVAVSCEFLGTVERITEELGRLKVTAVTFTGENRDTREDERIAYQRGEASVIVFTPAEGFNLHAGEAAVGGNTAPRATVVAEPRWSPKKALQAEGRSQRDGTAAPAYYMYATATVEENVIRTVVQGMRDTEQLHGSDTATFRGLAGALGVPDLIGGAAA